MAPRFNYLITNCLYGADEIWENIKMDTLRKVKFTMAIPGASMSDYETEQTAQDALKERSGLFHCFGNELVWDENKSCFLERLMGFVEEDSGQMQKVFPENIFFEKDDKSWMNNIR